MKQLNDWLAAERGRSLRLALHLGLPASFISNMASGKKPIPIQHMPAIERFTAGAVTRQQMRPDDWADIWPELAARRNKEAANV